MKKLVKFLKNLGIVLAVILGFFIFIFMIFAIEIVPKIIFAPDSIELVNEGTLTQVLWLNTPIPLSSADAKTLHITIDNGSDINMYQQKGDLQSLKIGQKVYLYDIYKDGGDSFEWITTSPLDLTQAPFSQLHLTEGKRTQFNCLYGKGDCK
jgi:hypothetical protein